MTIFELTLFNITISPTYYALMYIIGILVGWLFLKKFYNFKNNEDLDDLFFLIGMGIILGGRLGYVLLYNPVFYIQNPLEIVSIWKGGMSFHGGLIGVIVGVLYFCKSRKYNFWNLIDYLAIITPVGLGLGRFGNYLNNELYGFAGYNGPLAMQVNNIGHFPSPLLELILEGILLFSIQIYLFKNKEKFMDGFFSGVFLTIYATSRIIVEFFRLPDSHIGYLFSTNFLTIGMIYSIPMLIFGIYLINKNIKK